MFNSGSGNGSGSNNDDRGNKQRRQRGQMKDVEPEHGVQAHNLLEDEIFGIAVPPS